MLPNALGIVPSRPRPSPDAPRGATSPPRTKIRLWKLQKNTFYSPFMRLRGGYVRRRVEGGTEDVTS